METSPHPESPAILIVDDSHEDRLLLRMMLSRTQPRRYTYLDASTGGEALDVLSRQHVDCVLLDYGLPDENGLDLLDEIRAVELPPPVIMITGVGDELLASSAFKGGASDYLPKHALSEGSLSHAITTALRGDNEKQASLGRRTVTVDDAAEILGICRRTAYVAVQNGEIPTIRIGRRLLVPRAALDRMLASPTPPRDPGRRGPRRV